MDRNCVGKAAQFGSVFVFFKYFFQILTLTTKELTSCSAQLHSQSEWRMTQTALGNNNTKKEKKKKKNNWCKSWNHSWIRANQPVYRNKLCFGSVRDSLQNIIISKINCIFLKAESNIITMFFCLRGAFHIPSSRGDQINLLNPLNQTDWNLLVVSWTTDFLFVDVGDITRWVTDQDGVGSHFCPAKKIHHWVAERSLQPTDRPQTQRSRSGSICGKCTGGLTSKDGLPEGDTFQFGSCGSVWLWSTTLLDGRWSLSTIRRVKGMFLFVFALLLGIQNPSIHCI